MTLEYHGTSQLCLVAWDEPLDRLRLLDSRFSDSRSMSIQRLLLAGVLLLLTRALVSQIAAVPEASPSTNSAGSPPEQTNPSPAPIRPIPLQTHAEVCRSMKPAVVTIYAGREVGSGSIVAAEGMVLTSYHVVKRADEGRIRVKTSTGERYPGQVIAIDNGNDLALLQFNPPQPLPTVRLARLDALQAGDPVCAIGSPYGRAGTLTQGTLSSVLQNGDLQSMLRLHPGDSGGPLLNAQGEMIGVNRAIWQSSRGENTGISFATSLSAAENFIQQNRARADQALPDRSIGVGQSPADAKTSPSLPPPQAGLVPVAPQSPDLDADPPHSTASGPRLGLVLDAQTLVVEIVKPGSPAERAGLSVGDRLLAVNGSALNSVDQLLEVLDQNPGSALLTIDRQQQQQEIRVSF